MLMDVHSPTVSPNMPSIGPGWGVRTLGARPHEARGASRLRLFET